MIAIADIGASPFQPRASIEEGALEGLAASIRASGLIQPVAVRRRGGAFELIAGERRWRAAQRAGLERIPAIVLDVGDREAAEIALVENVQREALNIVERARSLDRLNKDFDVTHEDLAERLGLDRSSVTNMLRLLSLEDEVLDLLAKGKLSFGHGRGLLALPPGEDRIALAKIAARESWTVRQIESSDGAPARGKGSERGGPGIDPALADLEKQLGDQLGTRVRLRTNKARTRGRFTIEFYDIDHFESLIERLGLSVEG